MEKLEEQDSKEGDVMDLTIKDKQLIQNVLH
jgi:hypothetical protein